MARVCYPNKTFWQVKRKLLRIIRLTGATDRHNYEAYLQDLFKNSQWCHSLAMFDDVFLYFERGKPVALIHDVDKDTVKAIDANGKPYNSIPLSVLERALVVGKKCHHDAFAILSMDLAAIQGVKVGKAIKSKIAEPCGTRKCANELLLIKAMEYCLKTGDMVDAVDEAINELLECPFTRKLAKDYVEKFRINVESPKPNRFADYMPQYVYTNRAKIVEIKNESPRGIIKLTFQRFVTLKDDGDILMDVEKPNMGQAYALLECTVSATCRYGVQSKSIDIITDGSEWYEVKVEDIQEKTIANIVDTKTILNLQDQQMIKGLITKRVAATLDTKGDG